MRKIINFVKKILNNKHFSKRINYVYTAIVVIPLLTLFVSINVIIYLQSVANSKDVCKLAVSENAKHINDFLQSTELVNDMVNTNGGLLLFLSQDELGDEDVVIDTVIQESVTLERILSAQQNVIYGLRIFVQNDKIPERFPVIFHADRTNLEKLKTWEYDYIADFYYSTGTGTEKSVCYTRPLYNGRIRIGYIQTAMRMVDFFPFMYRKQKKYHSDYVLKLNENNESFESIVNEEIRKNNDELCNGFLNKFSKIYFKNRESEGTALIRCRKGRIAVSWKYIPKLNIIVLHTSNTLENFWGRMLVMLILLIGNIFTVKIFYDLIRYISSRMFKGIYTLVNGMEQVKNGNFDVKVPITHDDEIGNSQRIFNSMTFQLKSQIEQIKNEQHIIADTEMKAMQNQINAHFLYNVLETIHMQALLNDDKDTSESILMLGKMMRYCLRWRVHTVTLEQEIEYINSYIFILNIRNDYKITLDNEIEDKYKELKMPKMMIQPFIENSFYHGIEPLAQDAHIKIYTENGKSSEYFYLCVQDFGLGMDKGTLDKVNSYLLQTSYERDSAGSIGIKNIQQRLFMFFGKDYKLEIISNPGKGTLIRIPLPVNFDEEHYDNNSNC